jgi:hypothetical protein
MFASCPARHSPVAIFRPMALGCRGLEIRRDAGACSPMRCHDRTIRPARSATSTTMRSARGTVVTKLSDQKIQPPAPSCWPRRWSSLGDAEKQRVPRAEATDHDQIPTWKIEFRECENVDAGRKRDVLAAVYGRRHRTQLSSGRQCRPALELFLVSGDGDVAGRS